MKHFNSTDDLPMPVDTWVLGGHHFEDEQPLMLKSSGVVIHETGAEFEQRADLPIMWRRPLPGERMPA
jgi:hypothetical protein